MTVATYTLGRPRSAATRGGDCRARDLTQARNVFGPHRFAATTDCRISNGMLRLTVGASGAAPRLTVHAWRPAVTIGDTYADLYADLYGGSTSTAAWLAMGTITIDSAAVTALLTSVKLERITPEAVTLRLVAPLMADAFVTLRRGRRHIDIQHGSTRVPLVSITRRVTWTDSGPQGPDAAVPNGTASLGRVEEVPTTIDGLPRFLAAARTVTTNAAAFQLSSTATTSSTFHAGVGLHSDPSWPDQMHHQVADASRPRVVVT